MSDSDDFDDIPGTTVFTTRRSLQGFHLNQFCMSLMVPANRERFLANESAYLDEWELNAAQRDAVLRRDYNAAIAEGGNIYFLAKLFATDGRSFVEVAAQMTNVTVEEYTDMMRHGGRSPEGNRSIREGR